MSVHNFNLMLKIQNWESQLSFVVFIFYHKRSRGEERGVCIIAITPPPPRKFSCMIKNFPRVKTLFCCHSLKSLKGKLKIQTTFHTPSQPQSSSKIVCTPLVFPTFSLVPLPLITLCVQQCVYKVELMLKMVFLKGFTKVKSPLCLHPISKQHQEFKLICSKATL